MKTAHIRLVQESPHDDLARAARLRIRCAPHTTKSLARALGVSVAPLMRALDHLRKHLATQGAELVSVRGPAGWYYEIRRDLRSAGERWRGSALRRLADTAVGPRGRLKPEDEQIYGRS